MPVRSRRLPRRVLTTVLVAGALGWFASAAAVLWFASRDRARPMQAIATTAGTSKALLLYHFGDKSGLLRAVRERLDRQAVARLVAGASSPDAMEAWRSLARDEVARGELALLAALALEPEARGPREHGVGRDAHDARDVRDARDEPATRLATALLRSVGLAPRVPARFLGRVLLRHLDGLAVAAAQAPFSAEEIEAELDAFAIALLGLGR